jgi:hypothetical protein
MPGPFPAWYEPIASGRGIEGFVVRRGLAIAHRQARTTGQEAGRRATAPAAQRLVRRLARGRRIADYDELRYVIRKPEDKYARVLP